MKILGRKAKDIENEKYSNKYIKELSRMIKLADYNGMKPKSITITENIYDSIDNYVASTKDGNIVLGIPLKKIVPDITADYLLLEVTKRKD